MSQTDATDIRFNPLYAWMLIGFGCIFLLLGLFVMTPWAVQGSVALGGAICLASLAGIAGGAFWLKHLPVILRFTEDELQICGKNSVRWQDVAAVDVRTIRIRGNAVSYVCLRLKTKPASENTLHSLFQAARDMILGDYDIVLDEQKYSRPAAWLAAECGRRMGALRPD